MRSKVLGTLKKYSMLEQGDKVVVGVSGGADSVSLLHILKSLEDELGIAVSAVHVDHCLRGSEADRDREFTADLCKRLNVPLKIFRVDVRAEAERSGRGLEETGREIRYAAFNECAGENGKIATAHTLSDSTETVIFNMTRGSSIKGLCGIPPVRGNIIRPLINCTRSEIESYIAENSLEYVNDSTNFECEYSRNIIRLNVLPNLKRINPSAEKTIGRMTRLMNMTENYLEKQTWQALDDVRSDTGLDIERLKMLDEFILMRVILKWLDGYDLEEVNISLIKDMIKAGNGAVMIASDVVIRVCGGSIIKHTLVEQKKEYFEVLCDFKKCIKAGLKTVNFEMISKKEYLERIKINNLFVNQCLDYDTINSDIVLRNRRAGDFFRQANRNCGKTLKKLFNEKKLTVQQRNELLMLSENDEIIWLEGFGSCERTKVRDRTEKIFVVSVRSAES